MSGLCKRIALAAALGLLSAAACAQGYVRERSPLLYAVTAKHGGTVYLFGTVHVGNAALYPLPPAVEAAFNRSTRLALEIDPTDEDVAQEAILRMVYPPRDGLHRHVSAETFMRVKQASQRLGLDVEAADRMRPGLLSVALAAKQLEHDGYERELGLDRYLAKRAPREGKQVVQLESAAQQVRMLARLPDATQREMLTTTLAHMRNRELTNQTNEFLDAWATGNIEWMTEISKADGVQITAKKPNAFTRKIYTHLNTQMAKKIRGMLKESQTTFVAVGTMHLIGESGLVRQLGKKGYVVRQVDTRDL
jgi:uncharacterized protein YbaP (TraB family)